MTSLVTGAAIGPLRATTRSSATARYVLDTSAAPERGTRYPAAPGCHPLCQMIEL
jgi:hypothetical protein